MKKGFFIAAAIVLFLAVPTKSEAHDYDRDDSEHPLRYVAYAIHPIGIALEYIVFRPIHKLVSLNKATSVTFGHDPRKGDEYYTWK